MHVQFVELLPGGKVKIFLERMQPKLACLSGAREYVVVGFLIVLLIILMRVPVIKIFTGKKILKPEKAIMSVMSPKGLVPAVLASIPLQRGFSYGAEILDLGYSIVLFSIIISSILVIILSVNPSFFERIMHRHLQKQKEQKPD